MRRFDGIHLRAAAVAILLAHMPTALSALEIGAGVGLGGTSVGAGVGTGGGSIGAGVGASVGNSASVGAGVGASVGNSASVGAGVGASVGNTAGVGAGIGVGLGVDVSTGTTSPTTTKSTATRKVDTIINPATGKPILIKSLVGLTIMSSDDVPLGRVVAAERQADGKMRLRVEVSSFLNTRSSTTFLDLAEVPHRNGVIRLAMTAMAFTTQI